MRFLASILAICGLACASLAQAGPPLDQRNRLFSLLTGPETVQLIAYTPSQLDPRFEANQGKLPTSSIRADLTALRSHFNGLVLYGYHEACTPRIVAIAKELEFRAVILSIWNPKSASEIDGVAALARQYEASFALAVLVGNEGITFQRYEAEDLAIAEKRLRGQLPKSVPISTSEPLVGYQQEVVRKFGDFLCPNIHPVFDRKELAAPEAAAWARDEALKLAQATGKPVVLKETGFPHAGKDQFTPQSQLDFWQSYLKPGTLAMAGKNWAFLGVGFEAFDLPWKSQESKLEIEKSWGLFSPNREPHPALSAWRKLR
ncbi:MAG: hypothetical protein SFU86_09980 [Pirellulaceae bacterium]|nr:hypothetical protein [Pirellulaceae bacterium]